MCPVYMWTILYLKTAFQNRTCIVTINHFPDIFSQSFKFCLKKKIYTSIKVCASAPSFYPLQSSLQSLAGFLFNKYHLSLQIPKNILQCCYFILSNRTFLSSHRKLFLSMSFTASLNFLLTIELFISQR